MFALHTQYAFMLALCTDTMHVGLCTFVCFASYKVNKRRGKRLATPGSTAAAASAATALTCADRRAGRPKQMSATASCRSTAGPKPGKLGWVWIGLVWAGPGPLQLEIRACRPVKATIGEQPCLGPAASRKFSFPGGRMSRPHGGQPIGTRSDGPGPLRHWAQPDRTKPNQVYSFFGLLFRMVSEQPTRSGPRGRHLLSRRFEPSSLSRRSSRSRPFPICRREARAPARMPRRSPPPRNSAGISGRSGVSPPDLKG